MQNVDHDAVQKLLSGRTPREIAMIMTTFEADVIRLVREMAYATTARDELCYSRAAHALIAVAGNLGATHLEMLIQHSRDFPYGELMGRIRAVAQTTISELKLFSGGALARY